MLNRRQALAAIVAGIAAPRCDGKPLLRVIQAGTQKPVMPKWLVIPPAMHKEVSRILFSQVPDGTGSR